MTDERNPQDHARELRIKKIREYFIHGGGGHEDGEDGARAVTFSFEGMLDMVEAYAAHAASQLAGAVPQEELREVIAGWRRKVKDYWQPGHEEYNYQDGKMIATNACADELESLAEKRRKS